MQNYRNMPSTQTFMKSISFILASTVLFSTASAFGISIGQVDTFQNGSDNWQSGVGGLALVPSGGPSGAGDQYMLISAGASPLPPRLTALNDAQWLGNFTTAGVTSVAMDLLNPGPTPLSMRIVIRESAGGATTPGYASATPFLLPADGVWHPAIFSLNSASLTGINSPLPLSMDLTNVNDFRLLSSAAPSGVGDVVTGQFGVDNITAVPEPSALLLLIVGAALAWRLAWRCSSRQLL
jgi:hypothetical protein